jgi:hypothetical protein
MMVRRACLLIVVVWCAAAVAASNVETVSRVFKLEHVSVSEASAAVQPMLSEVGSLILQPGLSRMTVQDVAEVVDRVAVLIAELDRVPGHYRVQIELLEGGETRPYGTRDEIDAEDRLRKLFNVAAFRRLGTSLIEGELGNRVQADLGAAFRVSFVTQIPQPEKNSPWGTPDPGHRLYLRPLVLERVEILPDGSLTTRELLRTNVMLSPKQTVYIGAGESEATENVLVLIVHAEEFGSR